MLSSCSFIPLPSLVWSSHFNFCVSFIAILLQLSPPSSTHRRINKRPFICKPTILKESQSGGKRFGQIFSAGCVVIARILRNQPNIRMSVVTSLRKFLCRNWEFLGESWSLLLMVGGNGETEASLSSKGAYHVMELTLWLSFWLSGSFDSCEKLVWPSQ